MDCGAAHGEESELRCASRGTAIWWSAWNARANFDAAAAVSLTTAGEQQVQVQKVHSDDGAEVRLYCHSEARKGKEQAMLKKACARLREIVARNCTTGCRDRGRSKKVEAVWRRIGRLKSNSSGAGQHYQIKVATDTNGQQATAVTWHLDPVAGSKLTHPGVYCLRSNQTDWRRRGDVAHLHHGAHAIWKQCFVPSSRNWGCDRSITRSRNAPRPPVHHRAGLPVGAGDPPAPA